MDLSDVSKAVGRKRLNSDAEKLRDKVAQETSNIIKQKVAQDTAYWDVKERLSSAEAARDRLQHNILELQMQYEALSARYQDELQQRADTHNKVSSTREVCDALEQQMAGLRAALHRTAADRDALVRAYADATARVQRAHDAHARIAERARACQDTLRERLKQMEETNARLLETHREEMRRAEAAVVETRSALNESNARREAELAQNEQRILDITREKQQVAEEARQEGERARLNLAHIERELRQREKRLEAAARDLAEAREELSVLQQRNAGLAEEVALLRDRAQNLETIGEDLQRQMAALTDENDQLRRTIAEKDLEATEVAQAEAAANEELLSELQHERQLRALEAAAAQEQARAHGEEISARADTITAVERELAQEREAHARSVAALEAERRALEAERCARDAAEEELLALRVCQREQEETARRAASSRDEWKRHFDLQREATRETSVDACDQSAGATTARHDPFAEATAARHDPSVGAAARHDPSVGAAARHDPFAGATAARHDPLVGAAARHDLSAGATARHDPSAEATAARHDLPEHDSQQEPTRHQEGSASALPPRSDRGFQTPRNPPVSVPRFFSDSSMDSDTLDPQLVKDRFEALARGETLPPVPIRDLLWHRSTPSQAEVTVDADSSVPVSQVTTDGGTARRGRFFKTKRQATKPRKKNS